MSETKFEDLTISNDFMFKEVMKSNKGLCKRLVGSIMQQDIEDIVYIDTEKTLQPYYDSRGIRLDVILADKNHTRYNLEMQARNVISKAGVALLPKRTRYYQSVIDMDMLKKGENFYQLNPLVLIFICKIITILFRNHQCFSCKHLLIRRSFSFGRPFCFYK